MSKFKTIMLIDDNESDIFLSKMVIEDLKIARHLQTFSSAIQALEYFKSIQKNPSYLESFAPILILLDNNMPKMTGLEFLDVYNKMDDLDKKLITIVMLSSDNAPGFKSAVQKKCEGYIEKPLTSTTLLAQLEKLN